MEYNECPVLDSEAVNREHDELVRLVNQAEYEAFMGRPARRQLLQLQHYMQQHFQQENSALTALSLPLAEQHQSDHQRLLALVERAYNSGDLDEMLEILTDQLPDAIVQHIDRFDRQAVNWLKRHQHSAA
ncbi:hypothetical protein CHH28_18085 [Bacterioplanes sanyensis]|uniref:Hemerythrin-like domain-containing protein n=1 Tax=Bacterioplanes sanyensis TaxID=1249553 RepID=A0A222FN57_9GAMM|nr:hemerythrin family protein [Bacterioplanes sanyensis]ASP40467.1 hypothetical protein CHH28_18085 [Bacterioplanes sanyensis]